VASLHGRGHAISSLFHGNGSQAIAQVAGPVGIFVLLKDGSSLGYQFMLAIIAIISLTLALMNILPIPALDGGRLFLLLISRAVRRPLTPKTEELVNGLGMALLMLLFVVITVVDVKRNF
jgi:regulator of sigma E protease